MIKLLFYTGILLSCYSSYALECEWWQTKIKTHTVSKHKRNNSTIPSHARNEHCRERWNSANFYIKHFEDIKPEAWHSQKESFKPWSQKEKEEILTILASLPEYCGMKDFYFHRGIESEFSINPASIDTKTRSIVLYDKFFQSINKKQILVHEAAHYLYHKLSEMDKSKFLELAGWNKAYQNGQLIFIQPKVLIKEDSFVSPIEDYANHIEYFFEFPVQLKGKNPKIMQFLEERYKQ